MTELYDKYNVEKIVRNTDGQVIDFEPVDDWVFVLNPTTDPGARFALHAYAIWCEQNGKPELGKEIRDKIGREKV